jgi:hypothetical protein
MQLVEFFGHGFDDHRRSPSDAGRRGPRSWRALLT